MKITGLTLSQFTQCAYQVSNDLYGSNIHVHNDAHDIINTGSVWQRNGYPRKPKCVARLDVYDSHGPGSRTSWTGRHGKYACWHAYRDVLTEVFRRYPNAVIVAGHAWRVTYRGMEGFLATYPQTAGENIGSRMEPVTMPECCECGPAARLRGMVIHGERIVAGGELSLSEQTGLATTYIPGVVMRERTDYNSSGDYGDADYVSPAMERAGRVLAASAKLLGDKPADPYVFGRVNDGKQGSHYFYDEDDN